MNIRDIVFAKALFGNGGGGGAGGGSLPAGVYQQFIAYKPKATLGKPFVYNNSIHLLTKADSAKELLIYRLEGGKFNSVATITTSVSHSLARASISVLNKKVHILLEQYH